LEYLRKNGITNTVKDRYNYSKKYYAYLLYPDSVSELLTYSPDKRLHIMKGLTSLSKFLGCNDSWRESIRKHNIKWSAGNSSLAVFDKLVNDTNYSDMLNWIRIATSILSVPFSNVIVFNTLVGLRPSESMNCIEIIQNQLDNYWNKDRSILEHYKFPNQFIRRTKSAFISVVSPSIIEIAQECSVKTSYNSIRLKLKRKHIPINMYYCRKVFATYLRNKGIESEIIDLLQGRISSSVFVNHYYRPDINAIITKRIRPVLDGLLNELVSNK